MTFDWPAIGKSFLRSLVPVALTYSAAIIGVEYFGDEEIKGGDKGYLFLDEITTIHGWEGWLARIHEQTKGKLKIIASSSIRTVSNITKPLRGRVI